MEKETPNVEIKLKNIMLKNFWQFLTFIVIFFSTISFTIGYSTSNFLWKEKIKEIDSLNEDMMLIKTIQTQINQDLRVIIKISEQEKQNQISEGIKNLSEKIDNLEKNRRK